MSDPFRTVVVDDEPIARAGLRTLLATDEQIELVAECGDGQSAIETIRQLRPDIVFLDVQMPDIDGFEVLNALQGGRSRSSYSSPRMISTRFGPSRCMQSTTC